MREQDLISLGFQRFDENDNGDEFYYYTLDLGHNGAVSFISPASDEIENDEWYVEIFEDTSIMFDRYLDLSQFIEIVKRNTLDL